ncbi:MAG: type II secretion system F family protein [Patescibacteria group bacterium]
MNKSKSKIKKIKSDIWLKVKPYSKFLVKHVNTLKESVAALLSKRSSLKEQVFFAKRLSFLITAGVPILDSLAIVREQTRSPKQLIVINTVMTDVSNGQTLSKSLAKFPDMFGQFAVNVIRIGETVGTLSQNFDYLAEELKKKQALRRKIIGAFIYPAVITLATLCITAFLVLYLFPKIMPIFLSMHMKLPLSTRVVIFVSTFLQRWWLVLIVLVVVAFALFMNALKKNPKVREKFDRAMITLPFVSSLTQIYNITNDTRTIGLLLKSGISLSNALVIAGETSGNIEYRREWLKMEDIVNRGQNLSLHLAKNPTLFPHMFAQMVAVGEKSGSLSDSIIYVSEFYEHELDELTKSLSNLVEPALMVCMGLLIGLIAISIITPIYGITQNLHP